MNPLRNRSTGKIEATLAYETLCLVAARAIATRPAKRPQDAVVHTAQSDLFLAKLAETAAAFLSRGPASAAKVAAHTTVSSACARHNRVTHLVFQLLLVEVREDDGNEEVQHGVDAP
jgi:hypothetical protein